MIQFRKRFHDGKQGPISGIPEWMSPLLRGRGINTPEEARRYLHPGLTDLHAPDYLQDLKKALTLIRNAISEGNRILVYGDYDVDGICACTILLETLREQGASADFRIPSRHHEGYGLNRNAVEEIARSYQMLITVDCGISNSEEVERAKELGMTVIVTDHHELPETLPPADAIIHPLLGEYPFRRLCGAGVALKICQAVQGMEGVKKRIDVAALATVADIVPLTDENRVIVREGLLRMPETTRPGLRALMENAQVRAPLRSDDIGFRLGPRLNAAGRLDDASLGVRLLMTRDETEAGEIAAHLEKKNRERQENERRILSEAMGFFPDQVNLRTDRVIIVEGENWNSGLIGLVAGKLCERFHHPAIVLSRQGDKSVGSCRSIPGVNIYQMLCLCKDLLEHYGGHEQAAGLTVPVQNIPEFRKRLNHAIRENCDDRHFMPVKEYDSELSLRDVTLETVQRISEMEPTGYGNPAPVFLVRNASVQELRRVGKDGNHLRLTLLESGTVRNGIGFGLGYEADEAYTNADILFRPEKNEYGGRVIPQMQIEAIRSAQYGSEDELPDSPEGDRQLFLNCLQEMSRLAAKKAEYGDAAAGLRPEYLLKERFGKICMTIDELREVYIRLVHLEDIGAYSSLITLADAVGQTVDRLLTALVAFSEIGLMTWQSEPFGIKIVEHPGKRPVTNSPLIRYLWARGSV